MRKIKNSKSFGRMHLEMLRAVTSFAMNAQNVAITNTIEAFKGLMDAIKANITAIDNLNIIAASPVTGYAEQKLALKQTLAEFSSAIMQRVSAFAIHTNNAVLNDKVKASRSGLLRMSYEDLVAYVMQAQSSITPYLGDLAQYNVDAAIMTLWQANLNQLMDVMSNPKNEHIYQNNGKEDIKKLLQQSMEMMYNQCDQLALTFKTTHPGYYVQYKHNRKLIPLTRHTKLRVTVTNEINEPIAEVKVQQDGTDNFVMTGIDGHANLRINVEPGVDPMYSFTVSKGEISTNTGLLLINKGETVSRQIVMGNAGFVIPEPVAIHVTENK